MPRRVAVAVVGAGSAGLAAVAEIRKVTEDFVVIDDGPLGTMCARAGCMPSKALIQVAGEFHRGRAHPRPSVPEALARVRALRDSFVRGGVEETKRLGARLLRGRAVFVGPAELRVGTVEVRARRVILATGSRPVVPVDLADCGALVVTSESLFELRDLPSHVGVVGLGSVGVELGQALSRLGCDVVAFDRSRGVGRLTDPAVNARAAALLSREFPLHFSCEVRARARAGWVRLAAGGRSYDRELVLASLGRRANLGSLGLAAIGVGLDEKGLPEYDRGTLKLRGRPIYLAGDASARRSLLHEALDDGRLAGANSVRSKPRRSARRAPLSITFTDPNIALVGRTYAELQGRDFVTGEADFKTQARALIMGEAEGLLHVYAGRASGRFLGAEMVGPAGEHLAHLMAWSLQRGLTVREMLAMPFYHPTVEEGLRTALQDADSKTRVR